MNYTIQNNMLKVTISDLGAEIQSVKSRHTGHEYIWQANPNIWGWHAPILFPIVGRLKNDQYSYRGRTYHLKQHGFARRMKFKVESQSNESIAFVLTDTTQTRQVYPFKFELRVNYNLMNNLLEENFTVRNKTNGEMIFAIGGHPGFNVPLKPPAKKEDYYFSFHPSKPSVRIPLKGAFADWENRSLASTDSLIELSDKLFKHDARIFQLHGHDNKISLRNDNNHYHINVWTRDAPFVGIWSQYPQTDNFVCIEPWWGIADRTDADGKLEDKYGMNHLAANGVFTAGFSMTFHG